MFDKRRTIKKDVFDTTSKLYTPDKKEETSKPAENTSHLDAERNYKNDQENNFGVKIYQNIKVRLRSMSMLNV